MNELKFRLQEDEFINVFSRRTMLPKIDTIRDTLKVLETQGLKAILHHIVKRAVANKVFDNGTIDGYMVGVNDGTKFFGSNKKFCPGCLKNNKHNFHSGVVISTIGDGPSLTVGFEMYKP